MNYIRLLSLFLIIPFLASSQSDENTLYLFNDFISTPTTTGSDFQTVTSAGSVSSVTSYDKYVAGILRLNTSTSASAISAIGTYESAFTFGAGEWNATIRIDSLSHLCSATESYALLVGFFDTRSGVNQFDGAYFLYDSIGTTSGSASSDKWQTVTVDNGSPSFTTTSKTVSTSGHTLQILSNADGSGVTFVIDGESMRTETSTIPDAVDRLFGLGVMIVKSAGTTSRSAYVDYIKAELKKSLQK